MFTAIKCLTVCVREQHVFVVPGSTHQFMQMAMGVGVKLPGQPLPLEICHGSMVVRATCSTDEDDSMRLRDCVEESTTLTSLRPHGFRIT